jgi:hypothetical protein
MWPVDEYNARLGCFIAKNILFMRGKYIFYLFIALSLLSLSLSLSNTLSLKCLLPNDIVSSSSSFVSLLRNLEPSLNSVSRRLNQ